MGYCDSWRVKAAKKMNWEAIGAIIGAMAVVIILGFLGIQVRYSTGSMDESNRLQRAAAI